MIRAWVVPSKSLPDNFQSTAPTYLVFELLQGRRALWDALFRMRLDLLRCQHVVVQQELAHELVAVVQPQVRIHVERAAVLVRFVHDARDAVHQILAHLGQVQHVLDVGLQQQQQGKLWFLKFDLIRFYQGLLIET